jgi:hypothetical protein
VTGRQEIAAWAAARFTQHHRYVVGPHRAAGDTVRWRYREFVDPFQLVPGLSPTEGDAEAVVHNGRITRLALAASPASVQRQWDEVDAFLDRAHAAPPGAGPSVELSGLPRPGPAAEPAPMGWSLALGGLALLAAGTGALRRRRLP